MPELALQGFTKVQLQAQETAQLSFHIVPTQYCASTQAPIASTFATCNISDDRSCFQTVLETGHCQVFAGEYKVSVGGHQPEDVLGEATSNVVGGSFTVAKEDAWLIPRPDRG